MTNFNRVSYSLSGGIVITMLSAQFYQTGGEIAAVPGMLFEGFVNLVIVELTRDTFSGFVNRWMYFNVLFYATAIFLCLLARDALKRERGHDVQV